MMAALDSQMHTAIQENVGLATDLLLHAEVAVVTHDDRYVVLRTPEAPDYFSGNRLIVGARPAPGDRRRLEDDFAQRIGAPPAIACRSFAWPEDEVGAIDLDEYVAHGYASSMYAVLTAERSTMRSSALNGSVDVRLFDSEDDWDDWTSMSLAQMPDPVSDVSRRCVDYQRYAYRRLIDKQLGNWWGAFIGGELVGSLGLFFFGNTGRFQSIVTREDQRSKGICRTLLTEVVKRTAGMRDRLVMVADEAHHAIRVYESLGFVRQARIGNLCYVPG